jgi:AcrR family transcriptional regulator
MPSPITPRTLVLRRRHARARGSGAKTRERLVRAAALEFNRVGYHGTNSNRLARRAGFAPAVFYQHFRDKRAIFLAAYEAWVSAEWSALELHAARAADARSLARAIVAEVLVQHRRWRVFRASLRALVAADPVARRFYHRQRRRQLRWLESLRSATGGAAQSPAGNFLLVCTVERVCDAAADGELTGLDLSAREVRRRLEDLVRTHVQNPRRRTPPARPRP